MFQKEIILSYLQTIWKKNRFGFSLMIMILPVWLGFYFVYKNGINVIWWDQFAIPEFLVKVFDGEATFQDWFAQHNEHRILVPRLIFVILAYLSHYSSKVELYFTQCLFLTNLVILFIYFKNRFNLKVDIIWFVPLAFVVFQLRQFENMIWGFQLSFTLPMTFALMTFLAADYLSKKSGIRSQLLMGLWVIIGAMGAGFSSAMGLMVWPAVILQLVLSHKHPRERWIWVAVFSVIGLLQWIVYFHGFIKPGSHPSWTLVIKHPFVFVKYYLVCLGNIFNNKSVAFSIGVLGSGLFIWTSLRLWWTGRVRENGFLIGISAFILAMVLTVAIGRAGFGIEQALASRYTSYTQYFFVALFLANIPAKPIDRTMGRGLVMGAIMIILLLSVLTGFAQSIQHGTDYRQARSKMAYILYHYTLASDEDLLTLYPNVARVKRIASLLDKRKWNVFAQKDLSISPLEGKQALTEEPVMAFDQNSFRVTPNGVEIDGPWAVDAINKKAASGIYLRIKDKYWPMLYGLLRPDVANHFNVRNYEFSGVYALLPKTIFDQGKNSIEIIVLTHDQKAYYKPITLDITISIQE